MKIDKAITILTKWVENDRKLRTYEKESDFDTFCEERNLAIEKVLELAEIGRATEKAFECKFIIAKIISAGWNGCEYEANDKVIITLNKTKDLLEWVKED